jgi:hypothetical protein
MRRLLPLALAVLLLTPLACSRQGGDKASFCDLIADVDDLFMVLQDFDATDPEELDQRFEKSVAEYRALERAAPREIKPDVAELGNVVEDVLAAVQRNGDDRAAIATDLGELQKDHPGAAAAGLRVIDYADKECGIELQGGPSEAIPSLGGSTTESTPTTG